MTISATTRLVTRKAGSSDVGGMTDCLAAAFFTDPVFTWWISDDGRRREILAPFFRAFVEAMLPHGEVYMTEDAAGTALWLPPGDQLATDDKVDLASRLEEVTGEYAAVLFDMLAVMEHQHPSGPHYYLFFLATRPEWQSRGIGSALLRLVLDRADRDGVPAYLEASSERNKQLYLRHGFGLTGDIRLADSPPLWSMWREPH